MASKKVEAKNRSTHMTEANGNVFVDLGFSGSDAIVMQMKIDIHTEIVRIVRSKRMKSRELERLFDEPQPRISELMRGKIAKLSITKLTDYAAKLGIRPKITFERSRAA